MRGHLRFVSGVVATTLTATAGCGWILGLDEFTDQPPPGKCDTVADCPGGEHATAVCGGGVCALQCEDGFADCDAGIAGCETSTTADKAHCGGCGVTCSAYCVEGSCNDPVAVAAGAAHACAILQDGTVWCWGAVPGPGSNVEIQTQPTRIELPEPAIQIAAGGLGVAEAIGYVGHTCVLLTNGALYCWGTNDDGQLGVGDTELRPTPLQPTMNNVNQISLGVYHTCALDSNDDVFCWGGNGAGQVGDGTVTQANSPVLATFAAAMVSAGGLHTCAVKLNGSLVCWGSNFAGQIGDGSQTDQLSAVSVLPNAREVACGGGHTCATNESFTYCWGLNANGQLGTGSTTNETTPHLIGIANVDLIRVGTHYTGAVVGGGVYMWGDNSSGQLGIDTAVDELRPVANGVNDVETMGLGAAFACAVTEARKLLCWGSNKHGQLGDGTTVSRPGAAPVTWP